MKSFADSKMTKKVLVCCGFLALGSSAWRAEAVDLWTDKLALHGSFQTDMLFPENDDKIGSSNEDGKFNTNTYLDLWLQGERFSAGARFEYLDHPMPGFYKDFKGWGVPYFYAKGEPVKGLELTAGDFYEQFGSGMIFRAYDDRALGVDNAVRGGRVRWTSVKGLTLKALGGVQRNYWSWDTSSQVYGADVEGDFTQWISSMRQKGWGWNVGGGWVLHRQGDEDIMVPGENYRLNLPRNINAFNARTRLSYKEFALYGEYAWKGQDPNGTNNYTYKHGNAAMLSLSWMKAGKSVMIQARRTDNMEYRRSPNTEKDNLSGNINHFAPFTTQHTYALPALYPYSTLPGGDWAYQAEAAVNFKRHTALGGRYGTRLRFNASLVYALPQYDKTAPMGSDGVSCSFFKAGSLAYRDINVMMEKRLTKSFTLTLMYMNQFFDKATIQGEGDQVHSNIFVAEGKWSITPKTILRAELQYLSTKDDEGDWLYGLAELTLTPHWSFEVSDLWNTGVTDTHYYQAGVTGSYGAHRFNVAYGRTRAGYNCSGGVCRWVPATRGLSLSYNFSF
jgi:hypothetical protein